MAIEKIRPRVIDETQNYTFNNVTATGNLTATNANLGNLATANYVTATLTTNAQPNITSVGTLSNLTVTGNITTGAIKTNSILYANGSPWSFGSPITVAGSNSQIQFNDSGSFAGSANLTFDKTTGVLTVDGINANGSSLTNLTGTSVVGQVANSLVAGTVYTAAQPNITSVGTLISLNVSGTITSGNANLGNLATANFFTGSGNLLSNIQGANVTGAVAFANIANSVAGSNITGAVTYAATANAVAGANVLGQVGNALVASTVYTNAQPNITSVGTLSSLVVTGNTTLGNSVSANYFVGSGSYLTGVIAVTASSVTTNAQSNITSVGTLTSLTVGNTTDNTVFGNGSITASGNLSVSGYTDLGEVSNVKITGGTAGYVLQTDGTGNLSWTAMSSGGNTGEAIVTTVDTFTGDGANTTFTLSIAPLSTNQTLVNYNGALQLRNAYTLSGANITFSEAPALGSTIEVSTTSGLSLNANTLSVANISASGSANLHEISVTGNILPTANITYDIGSPTQRFRDLYLSGSTIDLAGATIKTDPTSGTIALVAPATVANPNPSALIITQQGGTVAVTANAGQVDFSQVANSIASNKQFTVDLAIAPEVLEIQVDGRGAGDDIVWVWTWVQSTLPYARATITNAEQASVPLYKKGTYQINNFAAHELHDALTQTHHGYLKWIDGAGTENNITGWVTYVETVSYSNENINGGATTDVQRLLVSVPEEITLPTLVAPNISYDVTFANTGAYTFSGMAGEGDNVNLGPMYRGGTYAFNLDASLANHPFYITTDNGAGFVANTYVGEYTSGVTGSRNNGSVGQTTITFVVPQDAPAELYYQCGVHSSMRGAITVKDLAVETNINGNYIVYFQHTHEGHKTPIEIRPIPSLVNQMCIVYDQTSKKFVPQDLATYVENTPSFKNKIREVAGTATLVAPDGSTLVPTVTTVEDATYLPFVNNTVGDMSYASNTSTLYIWNGTAWKSTKSTDPKFVTMYKTGTVAASIGTARYYPPKSMYVSAVSASLSGSSSTDLIFTLYKNGTLAGTYTILANSYIMSSVVSSITLTKTDYLTVNVTTGSATDLKLDLEYTYL